MGIPLYVIFCFSIAAFNIFSLNFIFVRLINMCLGVFLLGFTLYGTLRFLDLGDYFLSHIREFFHYNLFEYFLRPFRFLFFFWDLYNSNIGVFSVVPEVSEIVFNSFHSFCFILLLGSYFHHSASVILLLIPSSVVFISVIVLFISVYLFFNSSRSLLNIYFLHSVSEILDHLYYHYSELFFREVAYFVFIYLVL